MSYNPDVDYSTQSSKTLGLKPVLGAALASLEVQLDQELIRYRRNRGGYRKPSQAPSQTVVDNSFSQPMTQAASSVNKSNFAAETQASTTKIKITPPPPPPIPETLEVPLGIKEPVSAQEEFNLELFASSATDTEAIDSRASEEVGIVKATANISDSQSASIPQTNSTQKQPDDYLESSEALLRSLAEEQPQAKKPNKSNNNGLLSPLGIGSMLLLLLASLTLGYVAFNPRSLPMLS
ncbi:MAG: hypothetical protein HC908_09810 [Calothrix sp. SM1_7_51]|nr:hypothetical protein [Calothrix sp. SM1_7_51]